MKNHQLFNTSNPNCKLMSTLREGLYSDLSLVIGEKVIPAHKHIFALNSKVFNAMFTHEMSEKQEGKIKIDDFDAEIVGEMLNFIYLRKVKSMDVNTHELYEIAQKYIGDCV